MNEISFLTSLDDFVRQQVANRNQILYIKAIEDILRYISGEPMDYGLRHFVQKNNEEWEYRKESDYCWCGVDKNPYGFTVKVFQGFVMDIEEMAYFLWEVLYRVDEKGNEVMGEEDGFEYAINAYENLDVKALGKKYQKLSDMLTGCDIVNCVYESYEEIFSYASKFSSSEDVSGTAAISIELNIPRRERLVCVRFISLTENRLPGLKVTHSGINFERNFDGFI